MNQTELKEKASKIAAMMQSPYPHEAALAAAKLRKLLDDYNISMRDVGLKSQEVTLYTGYERQRKAAEHSFPMSDIKEILWKIEDLKPWEDSLAVDVATEFGAVSIRDPRGYIKLVGYPSDLVVITTLLTSMRRFVYNKLSGRSFRSANELNSFAIGVYQRAVREVNVGRNVTEIDDVKKSRVKYYVSTHFCLRPNPRNPYDANSYNAGVRNGFGFGAQTQAQTQTVGQTRPRIR